MKEQQSATILHELECFRQMGSVLYIAAHPDDENTELLAYLSRGRNYRTAYLSLTRGDGGQNLLSSDLGDKLGVARTQELLAARRVDGARQFFSRAIDFGFSKNYKETLSIWNKDEVLSDVVRIIRKFRPDVLIARFSPSPGGTHGHHTASTVLALEAFKLAGDPKAFPEQGLPPWQPKRIFWNISTFQREKAIGVHAIKIDIGGKDPISGERFTEIAQKSRSMHKTQGFDLFRLPNADDVNRIESFQLLDGTPVSNDIFDGIDTSWNRIPGGAAIDKATSEIIAQFDPKNPSQCTPALLNLRKQLTGLLASNPDPVLKEKQLLLDHILKDCLDLKVETTLAHCDIVPGESIQLHHLASADSSFPVHWLGVNYPSLKKQVKKSIELQGNDKPSSWDSTEVLPLSTPVTQPWWLRSEGSAGLIHVDDPSLVGTPENAPAFPIENIFEIEGQKLTIVDEPVQITSKTGKELRRKLEVIPPVWLRFTSNIALLNPNGSKQIEVEVVSARGNTGGTVRLEAPANWKISPPQERFQIDSVGQSVKLKFTITAPNHSEAGKITANAEVHGKRYNNQREVVDYPHLPPQLLQPSATMNALSLELATRGQTVGYLPGAGDSLADNLQEMGYKVKILDDESLTADQLRDLTAVVVGVRAFNVREHIDKAVPVLFDYINNGGTVIVQYNRPDKLKASKIAPYDLHLSADRVTDEKATMTFLAPDHPVLNTPNKITNGDFEGWVQERGLYFANKWDEHFTPILACNDPGEAPLQGGLLIAKFGKGHYIYTGLGFFRQLPAGVPGAYRLLANMIAISQ